jgi:hypothetical protein
MGSYDRLSFGIMNDDTAHQLRISQRKPRARARNTLPAQSLIRANVRADLLCRSVRRHGRQAPARRRARRPRLRAPRRRGDLLHAVDSVPGALGAAGERHHRLEPLNPPPSLYSRLEARAAGSGVAAVVAHWSSSARHGDEAQSVCTFQILEHQRCSCARVARLSSTTAQRRTSRVRGRQQSGRAVRRCQARWQHKPWLA